MYSILVDVTKCSGCEKCVAACIDTNNLNRQKADYDRAASKDGLSENRLLSIVEVAEGKFARKSCMHCEEPGCVTACLVGGLTKSDTGAVVYDASKCIGCRYCMLSCPYGIPRYEWSKTIPFMRKCSMCYDKIKDGGKPACVEACPNNAIHFGTREDMLKFAQKKIQNSNKYIKHIWGESERGGTSVLYISDTDLSKLGWAKPGSLSIPEIAEPVVNATPVIGGSVAASLLGITWIVNRRMKLDRNNNSNNNKNRSK